MTPREPESVAGKWSDARTVERQLGRRPRAFRRVAVRCPFGQPAVTEQEPFDADGKPFPTQFYVTCPHLVAAISRLEAAGGVERWTAAADADERLSASLAAAQAELHSLDAAARLWADRAQVQEGSNLALLLVQSEKLGSDTAATLNELATNFRATTRQRAEAHANRTSFWMLFPTVFCFWIASAIILIGPAYLEFFEYRQRSGARLINETRQSVERANRRVSTSEQVKRFRVLPRDFEAGRDEVTPTLKVKRDVVAKNFREELEGLYAPAGKGAEQE